MRFAAAATAAGLARLLATTMWTGRAAGAAYPARQAEPGHGRGWGTSGRDNPVNGRTILLGGTYRTKR